MNTTRSVVLARGLGTRMRAADPVATLTPDQRRIADAGFKPMMPVNGRPFLDYVLSALADAAISDVALVVAPNHEVARRHYVDDEPPSRIRLTFVVQAEPLGTAHAVLAAEEWANDEPFLVVNGDNLYPVPVLADLAALTEPGLAAFDRDDLVRLGNIAPDRLQTFALIEKDHDGHLTSIVEKPREMRGRGALISMNCWRFDARIFAACRDVERSPRGEFELPEAVGLALRRGISFRIVRARGVVLDLSRRADAADIAQRLAGIVPRP